jgi:hypothetical protein
MGWQFDLSQSFDRVGDALGAQGDLAGALKSYRDGLAIRDRLAKSDPSNTAWQRELGASLVRIGNVQGTQGDLAGALKSYRDGRDMRHLGVHKLQQDHSGRGNRSKPPTKKATRCDPGGPSPNAGPCELSGELVLSPTVFQAFENSGPDRFMGVGTGDRDLSSLG